MSYFDAYRARVNVSGASMQDAIKQTTRLQAINYIMNSPTLSYVRLNDDTDSIPVIESDKEAFHKRIYLFLPDTPINVGDYIYQSDNAIYLATNQDKDNIYPQLFGELCNSQFPSNTITTKVLIGRDPNTGRPHYEDTVVDVFIPCVTEYQSFMSNDGSFLIPEGRLKITIKYSLVSDIKLNREFTMYDTRYKITNVDLTKVVDGIGVATIISEVVS